MDGERTELGTSGNGADQLNPEYDAAKRKEEENIANTVAGFPEPSERKTTVPIIKKIRTVVAGRVQPLRTLRCYFISSIFFVCKLFPAWS